MAHKIQPINVEDVIKAMPAITDATLKVTCVYAVPSTGKRSKEVYQIGASIIDKIKGTIRGAEIAVYPDPDEYGMPMSDDDPDFPDGRNAVTLESVKNSDIFLFKTITSDFGVATAASEFMDAFADLAKKERDEFASGDKVAGVVVVGGTGARDLAGCILQMLNSFGFCIPPHAAVVYEQGSSADDVAHASARVADDVDLMVENLLQVARKLKEMG